VVGVAVVEHNTVAGRLDNTLLGILLGIVVELVQA